MRTSACRQFRFGRSLGLGLALLSTGVVPLLQTHTAQAAAPAPGTVGIFCSTSSSPNPTFSLEAKAGYIQLPDSTTMYMWGFSEAGDTFMHPGPVLCVNQGDTVTVVLSNKLSEDVSIMFPGQENVLANGAPAQPQGSGAALTSLTNVAPAGGSVTYSFVAANPGTFVYESGTNPQKQVRMGLFGALVVRPLAGADRMYNRDDTRFTPTEEFMVLLSEIDPFLNEAVERNRYAGYDLNSYHARYWLINGRGFPDSISDNFSPFLPDQPYGALARIYPYSASSHPQPGAIRYLNVGTEEFPFHPHGQNGTVIGRDGRPLENSGGQDLSFEKFAINIGPSQTWDVVFKWYDAENYSEANPIPVVIPQVNNVEFGMFYSGSPYLGKTGPLPPGASTLNQCGEYYIISHNHALYQITSFGVNLTGPITYVRVDPPLPNNCP